jgi:hypothetical protein
MKPSFNKIIFTRDPELIEEAHIYKYPILDLILAALLQPSFFGSEQNRPRLHNEDVAKLARSCLSETVVIRIIEVCESDFDISPGGLASLRNSRVGENIIEVMLSKASWRPAMLQATAPH